MLLHMSKVMENKQLRQVLPIDPIMSDDGSELDSQYKLPFTYILAFR